MRNYGPFSYVKSIGVGIYIDIDELEQAFCWLQTLAVYPQYNPIYKAFIII